MEDYSIEHATSSPHHLQSNGKTRNWDGEAALEGDVGQVEGVASVSHNTIGESDKVRRVDDG